MSVPPPSPAGLKMDLLLWHEWLTGTKLFVEELLRRCIAAEAEVAEVKRHWAEDTRDIEKVEAERDAARAEAETLRAALRPFASECRTRSWLESEQQSRLQLESNIGGSGILNRHLIMARAALAHRCAPSTEVGPC